MSACSTAGLKPDEGGVAQSRDLATLVRFGNYVQTLDEPELERQYTQLLAQYDASPSSDTAIKLSLLLSRPGARPADLVEALALLTDASRGEGEHAEFGWVMYHQIAERYVAATDHTSLSARLDEEHARSVRLDAELAEVRATLEAAERQRVALVQQLDALKAIEERISRDAARPE